MGEVTKCKICDKLGRCAVMSYNISLSRVLSQELFSRHILLLQGLMQNNTGLK